MKGVGKRGPSYNFLIHKDLFLNYPKAGQMKIIIKEQKKKILYLETKEEYKETRNKSMKKIVWMKKQSHHMWNEELRLNVVVKEDSK